MRMPWPESPLVIILGPTAVGKTEIAIQLAEALNGEIISVDSRLFYRGMDIGTAKPSLSERERVVHHLVDVTDIDHPWSLSRFQEEAEKSIKEIHQRGKLPFLVGGTGQYIRAVIEGWSPPEQPADPRMRLVLEEWGQEIGRFEIHRKLDLLDPQAARVIDPTNLRRTVRAMEVILTSGKRFSEQRRKHGAKYSVLQIGLTRPRPELYARIDARIEAMIASGLLEETKKFREKGYEMTLPGLTAIGYREMLQVLAGEISMDDAIVLMKRKTREYVRRQANWFKTDDPHIHWFDAGRTEISEIIAFINSGDGWLPKNTILEVTDEFPLA